MTTPELEAAIVKFFRPRQNIIVPNIKTGLGFAHECDLFIVRPTGYCVEVELKISQNDLIHDTKKRVAHKVVEHESLIKQLYFAIPEDLLQYKELIPLRAGILVVGKYRRVRVEREAAINTYCRKMLDKEYQQLAKLICLRIWNLKKKVPVTIRKKRKVK